MKAVEKYLCARCWQDVLSAGLRCEEVKSENRERRPCEWCGRSCYGSTYRIFYGGRDRK